MSLTHRLDLFAYLLDFFVNQRYRYAPLDLFVEVGLGLFLLNSVFF